jgi:ribosomal protein S12 methylthiotransferase
MKKLYFVSLGCTKNQIDSEIMLKKLFDNGFSLTDKIQKADFFLINTCGFLKSARDEAFSVLDDIFLNKKKSSKVIIAGCMANLFSNEIKSEYDIYSIISSGNIDQILNACSNSIEKIDKLSFLQDSEDARFLIDYNHLSYLKISDGCLKNCSFCIIPKIKGRLISKSKETVLKEFQYLLKKNVFEINLIAQDLLDYGKDRKEKDGFISLLKDLLKIQKDFWLRLLYIYPDEITDELIDIIAQDKRICNYLDLPLQHVSDKILNKMRRKCNKKKIVTLFEKLLKKIPDISIRASFIVGFPNETDRDFEELIDFVKTFKIDQLAVFKYANEKYSSSYKFDNQVSEEIKQKRFDILTKLQYDLNFKRQKNNIGKTFDAIVDGYHPENNLLMLARHMGQAYAVDSNIIINDTTKIKSFGKVYKLKITDVSGYDLIASPV